MESLFKKFRKKTVAEKKTLEEKNSVEKLELKKEEGVSEGLDMDKSLEKTFDQRIAELKGGETLQSVHADRNTAAVEYQNKLDEIDSLNLKGDLKDELSELAHKETLTYYNKKIQEFRDRGLELTNIEALRSRGEMVSIESNRVKNKLNEFLKKEVYEKNKSGKNALHILSNMDKLVNTKVTIESLKDSGLLTNNDVLLENEQFMKSFEISNGGLNSEQLEDTLKNSVLKSLVEKSSVSNLKDYQELAVRFDKLNNLMVNIDVRINELKEIEQ